MLNIFSTSQWTALVILLMGIVLTGGQGGYQVTPDSPCPALFRYQYDGNEWQGVLDVPYNALAQTIKVNVMLTVKARLPSVS